MSPYSTRLERIISGTKGKPCSCSTSKICKHRNTSYTKKRLVVEEPLQAPVTVVVDRPKSKKHVHIAQKSWNVKRESITESPPEPNKLCKWYRRQRALKDIEREHKQDKKRLKEWEKWRQNEEKKIQTARIEKARIEREQEYLQQLMRIKKEKALLARKTLQTKYPFPTDQKEAIKRANEAFLEEKESDKFRLSMQKTKPFKPRNYETEEIVEPVRIEKVEKVKPVKILKVKKVKPVKMKKVKIETPIKTENKKTKPQKKIITITEEVEIEPKKKVKKQKIVKTRPRTNLTTRFVNSCYRICCEFYCWMTIVTLIGLTIFCFI